MNAKSMQGTSPQEIRTQLEHCIASDFVPTLAFVFQSVKVNREEISEMFTRRGITVFGATTAGEFINGDIQENSIAVLLVDMDRNDFRVGFRMTSETDVREDARQLAMEARDAFERPSFIVSGSGLNLVPEAIVRGIEEAAGEHTTIFGGMAGDDWTMEKQYVFTNEQSGSQAILLLSVNADKMILKGRATCGWQPQGTMKTITRSEGQWIHTLDHQPALDTIVKYMGIKWEQKEAIDPVLAEFGSDYPLQLQRGNRDPVMRPVVYFKWDDRSVMVSGRIVEGDQIRFSVPAEFDVIDRVIEECNDVRAHDLPEADALLMFECAGRLISLGPLVGKEIEGVRAQYQAPMAGFFSYGEFGKTVNGNHEHHNLTCCWVGLKAKS
ncbi:MAG: FIST N-terminal domain-containing protein [Saprospiraceae bacterium]|nr:FIST N-terminal domain-containing protein [Saprospiraceae bacterium]